MRNTQDAAWYLFIACILPGLLVVFVPWPLVFLVCLLAYCFIGAGLYAATGGTRANPIATMGWFPIMMGWWKL